jgi:hypothetical protein
MAFHVPEASRIVHHPTMGTTPGCGQYGAFELPSPEPGWTLYLIADDGTDPTAPGWEHVSVHARRDARLRTPTWREMAFVKDLCWDDEDVVMQLHPRRSEYVNQHPHVLHLWRPLGMSIPTPPAILVGESRPESYK